MINILNNKSIKKFEYLNVKYSFVFVFFLTFTQFIQFIYDSLALGLPIFVLSGYLICHFIGCLLLGRNNIINKKLIFKNIYTIFFLFYLSIILFTTSSFKNSIGLLLYKDGMINWYLIGFEFYVVSKILFLKNKFKKLNKIFNIYISILLISYLIFAIIFYLRYACHIGNCEPLYQRMSINSYINFIILFVILQTQIFKFRLDKNHIIYPFSLIITFINHQARSLTTVIYWLNFFLVSNLGKSKKQLNKVIRYLFVSFLVLFAFISLSEIINFILIGGNFKEYLYDSPIFRFIYSDRIQTILNLDINNLNPVSSRINIIKEFPKQFMYSPFLGGWFPEIKVGTGAGFYQHSFILSLLTHTGLLGTFLFFLALHNVFKFRLGFYIKNFDNLNSKLFIQLMGIFLIANLHSFFNFPPFWFLFGLLSPGYLRISK